MPTSPLRELLQNSQFVGAAFDSQHETIFCKSINCK